MYDLARRLELTIIAGQFGLLCRETTQAKLIKLLPPTPLQRPEIKKKRLGKNQKNNKQEIKNIKSVKSILTYFENKNTETNDSMTSSTTTNLLLNNEEGNSTTK